MKKSEMNDTQKANYEHMRSIGIKKSWAKRLVSGATYSDAIICAGEPVNDIILDFDSWVDTEEGSEFWDKVEEDCCAILHEMSYYEALFKIPNNIVPDKQ